MSYIIYNKTINSINIKIMANKKYGYHPFLSSNFLKRNPENHCMKCGGKIGNIRPDLNNVIQAWVYDSIMDRAIFIGYCHPIYPDNKPKDGDYSMVH